MTDDGNPVDFKSFFSNALGKESFLSIDRVENNGQNIYGNFKAGQWGTFPVFFLSSIKILKGNLTGLILDRPDKRFFCHECTNFLRLDSLSSTFSSCPNL
jgi:hypothetical protein